MLFFGIASGFVAFVAAALWLGLPRLLQEPDLHERS